MDTAEHRFRTAAFGFNRQDVVHYIESVHREYAQQLESLKKELERERDQRTEMAQQGSVATQAASAADKDAQRAREELEQALSQLQEAQSQRDDLQLRLQVTERDFADLQKAAERMAPAARSYEMLKDKAATIELDAHNRAQVILKSGQEQAERTHREVQEWLRQVESSYERLKADVAATLTHAVAELDRTGKSLDQVKEELDTHGKRLHSIGEELDVPGKISPEDPAL